MKVVIVGGVAGGASAAARLRRLDEHAQIIMLERSGYVSYANCGLPYYISGVIANQDSLTLVTPERFFDRFRIDVRVKSEVTEIDRVHKTVTVRNLQDGGTYLESYDKLLLSPGAVPIRPKLAGVDDERIFTLRTVEDALRIRDWVQSHHAERAVVIGGGSIGMEMAESLTHMGLHTTVVEQRAQVLAQLDYDMACSVHAYLEDHGIRLQLNQTVIGFHSDVDGITTHLPSGKPLQSDLVVLAIGVVPETHLAQAAGLTLGVKGAIVVNEHMQTSDPDIYAVGDAVESTHLITKARTLHLLAGVANKQGRIAADHICGKDSRFHGFQGSSIIKLFDMTIATTGINESIARATGLAYDKVVTYSASHATYYPNATNMTIKTLFQPKSGKLLGAQIVGLTGVDKRIDVLASAIRAEFTAQDLTELELAYAPPYSSAKDPVNMVGYVIENVLDGLVKQFHWDDISTLPSKSTLLDVRTAQEYQEGHISGAVSIPLSDLRERLNELDRTAPVYVYCHSGVRSYIASRILVQNGFTCAHLSGGYRFYQSIVQDRHFDTVPTHACGLKIDA